MLVEVEAFLDYAAVERGMSRNTIEAYRNDLAGFITYFTEDARDLESAQPAQAEPFVFHAGR